MSMPLVIKQKEVSIEGCNLEKHRSGEPGDLGSKLFMVNQQGWSQLLSGRVHGHMSYGPALPIPSLLLPRSWEGSRHSPACRVLPVNSGNIHLFHASDEYTHFTTNRIPAAHRPPPSWHTLKNVPPRSRGLTKSILPLKFYQKYPFHCFHHCKSHTYLYLSQRKYK